MKINHSKPHFDSEDEKCILQVLQDAFISSGPQNLKFGKLIAERLQKKYAIPTQSGTDALAAALRVLKLKQNSKVAVPAYICSAPLDSLAMNGCIPVPVDIEKETLAISIGKANGIRKPGAIIAAHLFGIPAPFFLLENQNVIEDCAQTLSASFDGHQVGSMGRFAICSFYATKLLTTGHGGAIAVDEDLLFQELNGLFNHDNQEEWYPHLHSALSDLNAALGISQLAKLDHLLVKRHEIAKRFLKALGQKAAIPNSIFSRFLVLAERNINSLLREFNRIGIEAKRPVYKPLFQYLKLDKKLYPNAQWAHDHIISVPLYPDMKDSEIEYIETFLEKHRNEMRSWPPA